MSEGMAEPAVAEPAVEEQVAEPSAPSLEDFQALQDRLEQLQQVVQPPQPQPQPSQPQVPDPFSETYQQDFQNYIQAVTAPYQQFQEQVALSQAQEQAMEILDQHAASLGEFDRDMAWARANQLIYDNGGDPQKALEQAAKDVRAYEQRVGQQYYEQQIQQIQQNAGARPGMPVVNGGVQTIPTGGLGNVPNAVTRKFFGNTV